MIRTNALGASAAPRMVGHRETQAERQRPLHLGQNTTNEQGTYDPEAIKKFPTTSPKHNSSSTDKTWSGAFKPSQKHATDTSTTSSQSSTERPT